MHKSTKQKEKCEVQMLQFTVNKSIYFKYTLRPSSLRIRCHQINQGLIHWDSSFNSKVHELTCQQITIMMMFRGAGMKCRSA